jgi:hypothetical protein
MKDVSAASSRGANETDRSIGVDAATAPTALAPAGIRGASRDNRTAVKRLAEADSPASPSGPSSTKPVTTTTAAMLLRCSLDSLGSKMNLIRRMRPTTKLTQ